MFKDKEQSGWVIREKLPQPGCGWKIEKSIRFGAVSTGLTLGDVRQQATGEKKNPAIFNAQSVGQAVNELFIQEEELRLW